MAAKHSKAKPKWYEVLYSRVSGHWLITIPPEEQLYDTIFPHKIEKEVNPNDIQDLDNVFPNGKKIRLVYQWLKLENNERYKNYFIVNEELFKRFGVIRDGVNPIQVGVEDRRPELEFCGLTTIMSPEIKERINKGLGMRNFSLM